MKNLNNRLVIAFTLSALLCSAALSVAAENGLPEPNVDELTTRRIHFEVREQFNRRQVLTKCYVDTDASTPFALNYLGSHSIVPVSLSKDHNPETYEDAKKAAEGIRLRRDDIVEVMKYMLTSLEESDSESHAFFLAYTSRPSYQRYLREEYVRAGLSEDRIVNGVKRKLRAEYDEAIDMITKTLGHIEQNDKLSIFNWEKHEIFVLDDPPNLHGFGRVYFEYASLFETNCGHELKVER